MASGTASGDTAGLSTAQARRALEITGPNALPAAPPTRLITRAAVQLRDPMIMVLLAALVLVLVVGDVADAVIIAAVVVLNTTIGVVQEVRADRAVAALNVLAAPRARVVRDAEVTEINAGEVVPDDVVLVDAGDIVPADLRLTQAFALTVDESAMTGESVAVERSVDDELLSGTVVTAGRGRGTVLRTGAASGLGSIAALVASTVPGPTPLQRRLAGLSRAIVAATAVACVLVLAIDLARGQSLTDALVLAVSLGVAAVPESLPAVVSVSLALGAHRMARHAAVVRRLPAVETLGSVTVIASDKTGTLTEGRMTMLRAWTPSGQHDLGPGAQRPSAPGTPGDTSELERLLRAAVLCNDARLAADGTIIGDPMEGAILVGARLNGVEAADERAALPRLDERPFDTERRTMSTTHRDADGHTTTITKGAPEAIATLVDPAQAAAGAAAADALAGQGQRVIAVAEGTTLLGLVALSDPPRTTAASVVEDCRQAGIRTIMITGDHPATAQAIAEAVGIAGPESRCVDGAAVARGEHVAAVAEIDVYARTRPEQKVAIVEALQAAGDVVAMTGDGVNDAPALRRADIGVAMGDRGTEVARQAADLVLADDDLRTLVLAVEEGRRVYTNIKTFLRYAIAGGLAEVIVILAGPPLGLAVPLTPAMILWINMLTHGLPGVAFGGEPVDPRQMRRPSTSPTAPVLDRTLMTQILVAGVLIAAVSSAVGVVASRSDAPVSTWVFLALGFGQLSVALALRSPRHGVSWRGRGLEAAVALSALLQVAGVAFGPLRSLLGTTAVAPATILAIVAVGCLPGLIVGLGRRGSATRVRPNAP